MSGLRFYAAVFGIAAFVGGALAFVLSGGSRLPALSSATPPASAAVESPSSRPASSTPAVSRAATITPAPTPTPSDAAAFLRPVTGTRLISGTTLIVSRPTGVDGTTLIAVPVPGANSTPTPSGSPRPSPTGGPNGGVPIVNFGRSGGWQLRADGAVLAVSLELSPDRARIATWNLRTGVIAWLTPDEPAVRHTTPIWSADGALLYYAASSGTRDLGIYRIRADGAGGSLVRSPDPSYTGEFLLGLTLDGAGLVWSYVRAGGSVSVLDLQTGRDRAFDDSQAASLESWRVTRPRALITVGGGAGGPARQLTLWDDLAGTKRTLLGPDVPGAPDGVYGADFDSTGTRVVVAISTRIGAIESSRLITIDSASASQQAVPGSDGAQSALWFRAGIVYTKRNATGGTDVSLIPPSGGSPITLLSESGPIGRLTFVSP